MSMTRMQMMTGANTLILGGVFGWHYEDHPGHWYTPAPGEDMTHNPDVKAVKHPLDVMITMQEWIKALCGDHRPVFQRQEVTKFGEVLDHFKCLNCSQGETLRAQ